MNENMKDLMDHRTLLEQGYEWTASGWQAGPQRIARLRQIYARHLSAQACDLLGLISGHGPAGYGGYTKSQRKPLAELMDSGYVALEAYRSVAHLTPTGETVLDLITPESASNLRTFIDLEAL